MPAGCGRRPRAPLGLMPPSRSAACRNVPRSFREGGGGGGRAGGGERAALLLLLALRLSISAVSQRSRSGLSAVSQRSLGGLSAASRLPLGYNGAPSPSPRPPEWRAPRRSTRRRGPASARSPGWTAWPERTEGSLGGGLSATSRPPLGHLSAISRPSLGHLSPVSRPHLGHLSATSRPYLGRISAASRAASRAVSRPHLASRLWGCTHEMDRVPSVRPPSPPRSARPLTSFLSRNCSSHARPSPARAASSRSLFAAARAR